MDRRTVCGMNRPTDRQTDGRLNGQASWHRFDVKPGLFSRRRKVTSRGSPVKGAAGQWRPQLDGGDLTHRRLNGAGMVWPGLWADGQRSGRSVQVSDQYLHGHLTDQTVEHDALRRAMGSRSAAFRWTAESSVTCLTVCFREL
jgi:hypothetical protein